MNTRVLNQIVALGIVAGMRTMLAPALLSGSLKNRRPKRLRRTNLRFMQSGSTANILKVLAAGELIGDKLPMTPSRTDPTGLIGRGLSGALVGTTLAVLSRENRWLGGSVGASSALASAYTFHYLRKKLSQETKLPDMLWAGLEDVAAIKLGKRRI
ncbi:DUF4126 family protein [Tunicatimonas pelagia]|uniref:DUF4126 family protein n=1 Tax=Tunicatimonas pelagia TaxID=931531 RepID=UPI002666163B|nr:DUF4126 family protein [Tunicatimonas pelagia]WKN46083.1 DUF4126 family protein [Tunicatimonas pelagia]